MRAVGIPSELMKVCKGPAGVLGDCDTAERDVRTVTKTEEIQREREGEKLGC